MASDSEVGQVIKVLSVAFPHYEVKSETVKLYARLLGDLPHELLEKAALQWIAGNKFFPAIAELRETALSLGVTSAIPPAIEAWGEVMKRASSDGYYPPTTYSDKSKAPAFSHPLINRAVEAIGWREICYSEDPEGVLRAHFTKAYDALKERAVNEVRLLPEVREYSARLLTNGGGE